MLFHQRLVALHYIAKFCVCYSYVIISDFRSVRCSRVYSGGCGRIFGVRIVSVSCDVFSVFNLFSWCACLLVMIVNFFS